MDKLGKIRQNTGSLKNDLLKTKADIASQSRENLQTFVWWGQIWLGLSRFSKSHKSIWGVRSVVFCAEDWNFSDVYLRPSSNVELIIYRFSKIAIGSTQIWVERLIQTSNLSSRTRFIFTSCNDLQRFTSKLQVVIYALGSAHEKFDL